ncbi:hypothetical protein L4O78_006317 [Pseudomonas aeruginosa]|uniref:CdiI n=1 Tax=Pseudomonas aeruginosa TaxID=287 RepID=A0A4U0IT06_PSEAI|nr:hypothetical protein [Pseudomonas aeruginosa]HBU0515156.1 hypothetical protein [Klebsiella pneumoniae]EIU1440300.1 hypothetical protein [Pseudomonas aeruginosa]EIU2545378.1 hypothetical protein [Pseudomonas aeruginosa]EIU2597013.1 hypothetical protein [Pseudomonas aeruginosa]EIU2695885.1 hypothetical protein [Pseudomonas aeruginosa]
MDKVDIIRELIRLGKVKVVLEFVEGDSVYISDASEGVPQHPDLRRIWVMMVHHLRFVSEFGDALETQCKDGKYLSPHYEEFEAWLSAGAPGIADKDLRAYLKENPL